MSLAFFRYFVSYVFQGPTRQKLIFLTIIGLLISSFSLMVLQGVMGGLQKGLVKRSKNVLGEGHFDTSKMNEEEIDFLIQDLTYKKIKFVRELELELMVQNGSFLAPVILHGMDFSGFTPDFLKGKDLTGIVLGGQLGRELSAYFQSSLTITSPAHTSVLFRELPRQGTAEVSGFFSSELPEIDTVHAWVDIKFVQNLIRKRKTNKLRIYSTRDEIDSVLASIAPNYDTFSSWEDENSTLVWALNLETRVMFFLFSMMSILIGICIVSGYLIFFNKIKIDLASFWILGLPKIKALRLIGIFGHLLSGFFAAIGVLLGLGFLLLLDSNQIVLMPEHFVERNIPVDINLQGIVLAFLVPYLVAFLFTKATFNIFKRDGISFISLIKKVG